MSNKFQDFMTKLKENKKFRIQFVSVATACVVVLACAITIPVAVHSSNVKKAMTAEVESSTDDIVLTEEATSAEVTTEATTAETTTAAPTSAIADIENKTTPNSNNNSNGGGSGNKGNNADGSNGSSDNKKPTKPTPPTSAETTTDRYNGELSWTQADVDATVAEAKKYAISRGCKIYDDARQTVTINGQTFKTSWASPIDTRWDYKSKAVGGLKYDIDMAIKYGGDLPFLHGEEGSGVNIFSEKHDGYWEIYVVY